MTTRRRRKCKTCRAWFQPAGHGRPPAYCSAACRQAAYRARPRKPSPLLRALDNDLYAHTNRNARARRAIKDLEEMGYDVHLEKRRGPAPRRKPTLTVVGEAQDEDGDRSGR